MSHTYNQVEKQRIREEVLGHAVTALTSARSAAPIVLLDELEQVLRFAMDRLETYGVPRKVSREVDEEVSRWKEFYSTHIGARAPEDLRVLYLTGPEPLNDLQVLLRLGVNAHNVWGVESNQEDFRRAQEQITNAGVPLNLYAGSLSTFFEAHSEPFDIVYLDACAPFPKASTLDPIAQISLHERLTPLSVLITNFSEPPIGDPRYAQVLSSFFRYRYRDMPKSVFDAGIDPEDLKGDDRALVELITREPHGVYSDFVTRFIVDLFRFWLPSCRALSDGERCKALLASRTVAQESHERLVHIPDDWPNADDLFKDLGDAVLNTSAYPLLSFLRSATELMPDDSLMNLLADRKLRGHKVRDLLAHASMLNAIIEGHWACASEKLMESITHSWFDYKHHFSCDVPMPNLLVNSFIGAFGRPYFANPRMSRRLRYRAKVNSMYCDVLLMDQCRYYFDWFPTVDAAPVRFESIGFQVLARCIIDRLNWHDWSSDSHPFKGGAVACWGETPGAKPFDFELRVG